VPPYLVAGWLMLLAGVLVIASVSGVAAALLYLLAVVSAVLGIPGCAASAALAWVFLAVTRHSPWRSPAVDALVATVLAVLIVPGVLWASVILFGFRVI
jgi:hypothetical protein